jgi:geranylgeranyl diphosphate synthase, type II
MEFEKKKRVTESQYIEMIRLKTAVLLGFSLELGALLADASLEDRNALREFGINIGIGFQLKDDLLDVYADKKKFGKQVGGDIIANKKTFLLIKALEKARGKDKAGLEKWLSSKKFNVTKKVKAITTIYDNIGIPLLAERKIEEYFSRGFEKLNSVKGEKSMLIAFANNLIARQA